MTTSNKSFAPTWLIILMCAVFAGIVYYALTHGQIGNMQSYGGY